MESDEVLKQFERALYVSGSAKQKALGLLKVNMNQIYYFQVILRMIQMMF